MTEIEADDTMTSCAIDAGLRRALDRLCRERCGAGIAAIEGITPGLGTRSFIRVSLDRAANAAGPSHVIARIEAPEDPAVRPAGAAPEPPLEPLRGFLEQHGLPVPACYGEDPARGIVLLEDVGSRSLEQAAAEEGPERRRALYHEACTLPPRLQQLRASARDIPAFGRALDAALFDNKADKWIGWALPWLLGRDARPAEAEVVRRAFRHVAHVSAEAPQRLSHRDFKAQNLHLRRDAKGHAALVMIDLQGMFLAPPEYDLVCLLRDSHVLLPEEEVEAHLAFVRPTLPDAPAPAHFDERFTLLTLTRVGKDCAHYIHAATTRNDPRYLPLVPTALANLRRASAHASDWDPGLAALAELIHALPEPAPSPELAPPPEAP